MRSIITTVTTEDYLKAIRYLQKEKKKPIRSIELARYLKISKPSVSQMLRRLADKGFIKFKAYKSISLTKKGLNKAEEITSNHRIIEVFLKEVLKVEQTQIHKEAHKLEHAFSRKSINKIRSLLKDPKFCPHGRAIQTK